MARTGRLLDIMQALRIRRRPVSAEELAREFGVSPRTIYRDIATLQAQGADIAGEAGVGDVLRAKFTLPPLMFSREELDALILGSRFVARNADPDLAAAAAHALAKIEAVLPEALRETPDAHPLFVPGFGARADDGETEKQVREAIRRERKIAIAYVDRAGAPTARVVWPIALAFFEKTRICAAWCETRADFRHFRIDRMAQVDVLDERYPIRRTTLARQWRMQEGLDADRVSPDRN